MIKKLKRNSTGLYHYDKDGKAISGPNPKMMGNFTYLSGDCTGLYGDCSRLRGNCTHLKGNCSWLKGNCTGLTGNCTGLEGDCTDLKGNLDECDITREEREEGINIEDLIEDDNTDNKGN